MTTTVSIPSVTRPICGVIRPPGSKSLTNRALIIAALAEGTSSLNGLLDSQDTRVMIEALQKMGLSLINDFDAGTTTVQGCSGKPPCSAAGDSTVDLWVENSGTSVRFLTAFCALADGQFRLDGNQRMRERPIGDLVSALNSLGGDVHCENNSRENNSDDDSNNCPPVVVRGNSLLGGAATVSGAISSQYLSALLMVSPCANSIVELNVTGELVSEPYIDMTLNVMKSFGVTVEQPEKGRYRIAPQTYQATNFSIEPDASAASYFFAAAAITKGSVTVQGLSRDSEQGDVQFVNALEKMGCTIDWQPDSITVHGNELHGNELCGIEIDMNSISDTAQTLAAVALFAKGTTRITNIAHVRHKETDRIAAVATELRRLGITVDEQPDGLTIHPGPIRPATIQTYDDHRMAMSFALIGLKTPGIKIANPDCTAKTYPQFFNDLQQLCNQ